MKYANWIGGDWHNGRYEVKGEPWISIDGMEWMDSRTNELLDTDEFHNSSITLIGGPMNGEVIG